MFTKQRELADVKEAKANLFHSELKVLQTENSFHNYNIKTLNNSLKELQYEDNMLKDKIIAMDSHKGDMKFKWEKEQVSRRIAQEKKKFKRFIPSKKGLRYVKPSFEKCV